MIEGNLVVNGGFETAAGDDPVGWEVSGRARPNAVLRSVAIPGAPEDRRVAEISLEPGNPTDNGYQLNQTVRVDPQTTYDLSAWVRGIDLISAVDRPNGFGRSCGLTFLILGPSGDLKTRVFPSSASPRRDGTTPWELRTMRFTTPPRAAFRDRSPDADERLHLRLMVQLFGHGTIQVDDVRLARSAAAPPPARRTPGRLALATRDGAPFFALGLYRLPTGMAWTEVAEERIFNLAGGSGNMAANRELGFSTLTLPWLADPACRGCSSPTASECAYCRRCSGGRETCGGYAPDYLSSPGCLGVWIDEPNFFPEMQGALDDLIDSARRIHQDAERLRPSRDPIYLVASDMPGGVYFNTYGWDDLARYHASEAFDVVASIRRGGNPRVGSLGGSMSEYPQTSVNGIRNDVRRLSDDVTDAFGSQIKPVWMLVNGGSGLILSDPADHRYRDAPHNAAELLAMRPNREQLRYMLYAAILNGATGFLFYQDEFDTLLTPDDPYWSNVLLPAAAELATLERATAFLTQAEVNPARYRLTGESDGVDSMLKRVGEAWILVVANSSPLRVSGIEFVLEEGVEIAEAVVRLAYRHDSRPEGRQFEATPAGKAGGNRFPLDLPGYGVALYRFRLSGAGATLPASDPD